MQLFTEELLCKWCKSIENKNHNFNPNKKPIIPSFKKKRERERKREKTKPTQTTSCV
jgi:hypothetical protein